MQRLARLGSVVLLVVACGCTHVTNLLVTPHPLSLQEAKPRLALNACPGVVVPQGLALAPLVAGAVMAAIQKALADEANQYKASYSGAASGLLRTPDGSPGSQCPLLIATKPGGSELARFQTQLASPTPSVLRLQSVEVTLHGFESKVAAWPIVTLIQGQNPFAGGAESVFDNAIGLVNPLMLLHAMYGLVASDTYKVDVNARMRISVVATRNGQYEALDLGAFTLPLGKVSIFDLKRVGSEYAWTKKVDAGTVPPLDAGYLPFPTGAPLPANVTVSVVEGNDFGDLVGKAAGLVGDKKDDLAKKLEDWIK